MPCGPTNPANISTPVNWLLLEHKLIHFGSVWQLSRYNVRNESLWENMIHKDENIYSLPRFWKFASPWYVLNDGSGLIAKLYLTLRNPMDYSPPGLSVWGISQMRILEWVAMSSSRGSSWPSYQTWASNIAGGFFTDWAIRSIPFYEWGGGHGTCPEVSKLLSDFTPGVSCRACSIAQVGLNQALIPKQM